MAISLGILTQHFQTNPDDGKCDTSHPAPKTSFSFEDASTSQVVWRGFEELQHWTTFLDRWRRACWWFPRFFWFSIWTLKDHSHRPKLTVWFLDLDEAIQDPIMVFGNINLLRPKKSDAKTHLKGKLLEFLLWILCCSHCNHWGQRTSRNCLAVLSRTLGSAQTWETPKK